VRSRLTAIDCFTQGHSLSMAPCYSKPTSYCCCCRLTGQMGERMDTDFYTDPVPHMMWVASINQEQARFCGRIKLNLFLCSFIIFYPCDTISQPVSSHDVLGPKKQSVLEHLSTVQKVIQDGTVMVQFYTGQFITLCVHFCLQDDMHETAWCASPSAR